MFLTHKHIDSADAHRLLKHPSDLHVAYDDDVQIHVVLCVEEKDFEETLCIYDNLIESLHFPHYAYREMIHSDDLKLYRTHFHVFPIGLNEKQAKKLALRKANYDFMDAEHIHYDGQGGEFENKVKELLRNPKNLVLAYRKHANKHIVLDPIAILRRLWNDNLIESASMGVEQSLELKCRLEHNHWCATKILEGFRPLNADELSTFERYRLDKRHPLSDSAHWSMHKEMYKQKRLLATMKNPAHLDLCSFDELWLRDFSTVNYDLQHFNEIVSPTTSSEVEGISTCTNKCLKFGFAIYPTAFIFSFVHFLMPSIPITFGLTYGGIFSYLFLLLGVIGMFALPYIIGVSTFKTNVFDRFLAEFGWRKVLTVSLFIISIPSIFAIIAACSAGYNADDMYADVGYQGNVNYFWTFLYQFIDPGNQHMVGKLAGLKIASWVAVAGLFLLNGLLVSTVMSFVDRRVDGWTNGNARYNLRHSKHIVIIGGHEMVAEIIRQTDSPQIHRFVMMTELDVETYRTRLSSQLPASIVRKLIIYHGDRTSAADIASLHLSNSSLQSIYVIGEGRSDEEVETNHDAKNMTCAELIALQRKSNNDQRVHCYVMYENNASFEAFLQADLPSYYKQGLYFEPFNMFEMCAQQLLTTPSSPVRPIDVSLFSEDLKGEKNYIDIYSERRVHLVIFGMSAMGQTLATETAVLCHYPNYALREMLEDLRLGSDIPKGKLRTLITFIDNDIDQPMLAYKQRMPSLFMLSRHGYMNARTTTRFEYSDPLNDKRDGYPYAHLSDVDKEDSNFLDIEWEFINGSLGDVGITQYLAELVNCPNDILTIALCHHDDLQNLTLVTQLPLEVHDKAEQVLVYQRQTDGLVRQMSGQYSRLTTSGKENKYSKLRPFGMYATCFSQSLLDHKLATMLYSTNYRRLRDAGNEWADVELETLSSLPILERWSAVYSSWNWHMKFRSMGSHDNLWPSLKVLNEEFSLTDSAVIPLAQVRKSILWGRVEHNRWNIERLIKIGEMPVTADEDSLLSKHPEYKNSLKASAKRSHYNICSMSRLQKCDPDVVPYDIDRNYRLIQLYEPLTQSLTHEVHTSNSCTS